MFRNLLRVQSTFQKVPFLALAKSYLSGKTTCWLSSVFFVERCCFPRNAWSSSLQQLLLSKASFSEIYWNCRSVNTWLTLLWGILPERGTCFHRTKDVNTANRFWAERHIFCWFSVVCMKWSGSSGTFMPKRFTKTMVNRFGHNLFGVFAPKLNLARSWQQLLSVCPTETRKRDVLTLNVLDFGFSIPPMCTQELVLFELTPVGGSPADNKSLHGGDVSVLCLFLRECHNRSKILDQCFLLQRFIVITCMSCTCTASVEHARMSDKTAAALYRMS